MNQYEALEEHMATYGIDSGNPDYMQHRTALDRHTADMMQYQDEKEEIEAKL